MTPEGKFQKRVIEAATRLGWRHYHAHDPRRDKAGFPDLVMVRRGRLIFAELKRDAKAKRNEVSDAQQQWIWDLEVCEENTSYSKAPVRVFLWCPDDWDEVLGALK